MFIVCKADESHAEGISKVCTEGYWTTYQELFTKEHIERVVEEFYNYERILGEVTNSDRNWGGYFVAVEDGVVVGAGGGGMIGETTGELFVLYVNPNRRNEGIGTMILDAVTNQQMGEFNATEQWVSVAKGNMKGIPFYEAKGFVFKHERISYSNSEDEDYVSLRYYRKL
ncbi:GNAT family N-acetyltransferase [Bacillus andreraoultii]|uniref:GNAT family N-acetyltransferase n=1 Tax=Bacillus andreraoultii TaxID=1499685 RepID=UPI00053BA337|nr:GNAT family N-acetyltransferase [Bacillus andreraoultii]